jgi:hypothetical protein
MISRSALAGETTSSHVAPELSSEAALLMAGALGDGGEPQPSGSIRRQPP